MIAQFFLLKNMLKKRIYYIIENILEEIRKEMQIIIGIMKLII